ncbi:hypothetical protein MTR67_051899 [Solanum verrucosum]|uniref:Uncharacterized protein n=1 Tax=Solanum verrucosum TaxID=315347 RepID=A0AAF0V7F5_SOLVR|nr:hypothetical protein MTR67_051899 [Solanum verrucosum]
MIGEWVLLKVTLMKSMMKFEKNYKLRSRGLPHLHKGIDEPWLPSWSQNSGLTSHPLSPKTNSIPRARSIKAFTSREEASMKETILGSFTQPLPSIPQGSPGPVVPTTSRQGGRGKVGSA